MAQTRRTASNEPVIDDYPVRPNTINLIARASKKFKILHRNLVLFSLIYFLYGVGLSLYGLLYPAQARKHDLNSCNYGSVLATSHLVSVLVYPAACRMVCKVSSRNSLSVGVFVIGICRALFGTLDLISEKVTFIGMSYAVQIVEGIGTSILIASTVTTAGIGDKDRIRNISFAILSSLSLGLTLGPIGGQFAKEELGYDILFYIIGGLTALSFIIIASLLKEPDNQVLYTDIPIIYWMKDKRMLFYFFITFASFNYSGYLSVSLEHLLKQFRLKGLSAALLFSVSPFVYGLSVPGWTWLVKKGFNSVMMVFIGAIIISASLLLLGPVPYTVLESSLPNVSWALVLQGLGLACKSACVLDASQKDLRLRNQKKYSEIQRELIIPTIFLLGASFGYFCGCLTTGFTNYYIGYRKATLPLYGLEICAGISAVIFAFNSNYVSERRRRTLEENQPIIRS